MPDLNHQAAFVDPMVAESDNKNVTLIRYIPLKATSINAAAEPAAASAAEVSNQTAEGSLILHLGQQQAANTKTMPNRIHKLSKKVWAVPQQFQQHQLDQASPKSRDGAANGAFNDDSEDAFRIVWTALSFGVGRSKYDKLISAMLGCVKNVCNVGAYCGPRQEKSAVSWNGSPKAHLEEAGQPAAQANGNNDSISSKMADLVYESRIIFDNLNGSIKSGELSAILGPSGAGKTSLLNALCGRAGNYGGRIQLLGGSNKRRMRLSIIPQKDYLIENLTVKENLIYSSRLLNPDKNFNHEANILSVVKMLNLSACFKSVVANISGGEYKRVSIAQELLRQPDILVLDEPTSGLDSLNCKNLISALLKLIEASRKGLMKPIAVVMTIHQPDVDVFHMFDHVYCMARGGRVIYEGHPRDAMQVIRSQANLTSDQRLSAQLESDSRSMNNNNNENDNTSSHGNIDHLGQPGTHITTNPANLLIEIASEDVYGREPIERLAKYQLKQFEQLQASITRREQPANSKDLSQLQANMLAANQLDSQASQPDRLSPHLKKISSVSLVNNSNNYLQQQQQQQRSLSASPSPSLNSASNPSSSDQSSMAGTTAKSGHLKRDKRLNAKNDHSGLFWYHTRVLAQRAFVSTLRDPLMTIIALIFHLFIPFVMWTVYPRKIGYIHGCPISQRDLDLVSMASDKVAYKLGDLQDQVTTTLECSTMFFLTTYSFSMCSLSVAALAFPLNMHILLKEVRNGWYNMPSFVLAKTIANFPFEVLFPVISLIMIYVMLGMPSSEFEWRLWSMAIVMGLISMISHTQGLIFGALCMDSVQTAIFLASASSLPQTLLSGFTARIKHMPWFLQRLSWLSQYRYSSDLINMIRFGFGICPCDSDMDKYLHENEPNFRDIPDRMKSTFVYFLVANTPDPGLQNSSTVASVDNTTTTTTIGPNQYAANETTALVASSGNMTGSNSSVASSFESQVVVANQGLILNDTERYELLKRMEANEVDLFGRLADLVGRSFSFGRKIDGCPSVRSQLLVTGNTPTDDYLPTMFGCMIGLLILSKILLLMVVRFKIGRRI